jgi:hypothetical protein
MFDIVALKNGQRACMSFSIPRPSGASARNASTADPKPYQPGSISRHCPQLKTHGIARKSSIRDDAVRDAGRLPIYSSAISEIGVDARK